MDGVKSCHFTTESNSGLDAEGLCAHNVFSKHTQEEFTNVTVLPWSDCVLQGEGRGRGEVGDR